MKMITPMTEITNSIMLDCMNMFTMEAMMMPMSPMKRKEPQPVRSRFVVYPQRLIAPKVAEVMKNTRATLAPVYIKKIGASPMPMRAAKTQKVICALEKLIFCIRKLKKNTIPSGARKAIQPRIDMPVIN